MNGRTEFEAAIVAWARHDPLGPGDEAALARIVDRAGADAAAARRGRIGAPLWLAGGAVAASVAVALLLVPGPRPEPAGPGATMVIEANAAGSEGAAFALLYTPTVEEEYLL